MAKKSKAKISGKKYCAWVKFNAILGFDLRAENLDQALAKARDQLKSIRLVPEYLDYIDGKEELTGVIESDD